VKECVVDADLAEDTDVRRIVPGRIDNAGDTGVADGEGDEGDVNSTAIGSAGVTVRGARGVGLGRIELT
jgi:hypothetical protein